MLREGAEEDVELSEFSDEIEGWIIEEFHKIGLDTAKSVLEHDINDLVKRTDLEEETIRDVINILKEEFGMKPLGFVYDWLLTSQKARHNIAKMAGALDTEVIYRCGDYERQAKNIRKNINGFLKDPDLGMLTFVQAGDKEMYHYGRKIREENNLELTVWGSGFQLEQREFFVGYCGIDKTLVNNLIIMPFLFNVNNDFYSQSLGFLFA